MELQISVIFILPETKGITLERMDKIFGEVDVVEAGETELDTSKQEATVIQHVINEETAEIKEPISTHVEDIGKDKELS